MGRERSRDLVRCCSHLQECLARTQQTCKPATSRPVVRLDFEFITRNSLYMYYMCNAFNRSIYFSQRRVLKILAPGLARCVTSQGRVRHAAGARTVAMKLTIPCVGWLMTSCSLFRTCVSSSDRHASRTRRTRCCTLVTVKV